MRAEAYSDGNTLSMGEPCKVDRLSATDASIGIIRGQPHLG